MKLISDSMRYITLPLLILLMLTGCGSKSASTTPSESESNTSPTTESTIPETTSISPDTYGLNIEDNTHSLTDTQIQLLQNIFQSCYEISSTYFHQASSKTATIVVNPSYDGAPYIENNSLIISPKWLSDTSDSSQILLHEFIRMALAYPQTAESWIADGIASYVADSLGFNTDAGGFPSYDETQNYTDGGSVTAAFLLWVNQNTVPDLINKIDSAVRNSEYTEQTWYSITGKTVNFLWDTYAGKLNSDETAAGYHIYIRPDTGNSYVTLDFAGDVCLSEDWPTLTSYDEKSSVTSNSISPDLLTQMNSADLMMLNNEFTFSNQGEALSGKLYTFRANPERVSILQDMGVDIVSLANNHCYDYGAEAFYDTMDTLTSSGIPYVGAGKNQSEADQPIYYVINGMKIAYVAATRAEKVRYTPGAKENSPGVLLTYDPAEYLKVIQTAASQSDYVVAYVHWGTENSHNIEQYQKDMARQFIDAGADVIIGGHPHVLQGIEYYNGKPIVYSLGDFWFNEESIDTGLLELRISAAGLSDMIFLPCKQENIDTSLVTDESERSRIIDYMNDISIGISIDSNGIVKPQ